ncbi:MAG: CapA family protein [Armatimonadota bacterium]|nr:CapA family protein [Armatimonadota bacterium]MDW8105347.1 CapA family protein [Armatimonadota bacterium]
MTAARPVTVLATGDIMLVLGMTYLLRQYGAKYPFQKVRPLLSRASILVGNLEAPFTLRNTPTPYKSAESVRARRDYILRAEPRWAQALVFAGFDAVGLANNHLMDYQEGGLYDTLRVLDRVGIAYAGAGRSLEEARRPAILKRDGLQFALLSYSCILPVGSVATSTRAGIAPARGAGAEEGMRQDIQTARERADFVLVSIHWGKQLAEFPESTQRRLGRLLIDWGADAVVGHHPHVLQGIEVYREKVIAYSLGDFVNLSSRSETAVLQLVISRPHAVDSAGVIPLRQRRGQLHYADGRAWKTTIARLNRLSAAWGTRIDPFGSVLLT